MPDEQAWQTRTADMFGQLYTAVWQQLAPLLGADLSLEVFTLSTAAIRDAYPFLDRLVWQPYGLVPGSLLSAVAGEEQAYVTAGCERLLHEIQQLVQTCGGAVLAQRLQAMTERLRHGIDPASEPSPAAAPELVAPPAARGGAEIQSIWRQSLRLYRQVQAQQAALQQARAELATLRHATPISSPGASDLPPSCGDPADDGLARSERFYYDLFELSPDGVVMTNTDGDILQANLQCAEILDFDTPAELIGRKVSEFYVQPERRDSFLARISQQQRIEGQRQELRTNRGRTIIVMASSRLIDYEGRPCLLSVLRDVTERARLRQEMEDFAYSASHDLQAPLRTFEGYARWLLEDYGDVLDEVGRQLCEEIIDDALHMKKLLDGLLEYSRIGRLHTEAVAVDVLQVLEWVQHDLQIEIADTGARITLPETLPTVFYPEVRLTQIFSNLLSNALKFTAANRPVEIAIGCEILPRHYRFTVRDNGIGIAPEHYTRIFEIFKRLHTREDYPGTGAGLTIVKKIVESHGGHIGVESTLGEGTIFWFTIPKTEGAL
jgi:PAS domain S-box-containing protein